MQIHIFHYLQLFPSTDPQTDLPIAVQSTVFKNKLLTKVDAQTNGWRHENRTLMKLHMFRVYF